MFGLQEEFSVFFFEVHNLLFKLLHRPTQVSLAFPGVRYRAAVGIQNRKLGFFLFNGIEDNLVSLKWIGDNFVQGSPSRVIFPRLIEDYLEAGAGRHPALSPPMISQQLSGFCYGCHSRETLNKAVSLKFCVFSMPVEAFGFGFSHHRGQASVARS